VISIGQNSDFGDIDQCLVELEHVDQADLEVPLRFVQDRIGFRAAVIQAIITWARHKSESHVIPCITKPDQPSDWLQPLCATEHGLVAMLMAPRVETPEGISVDPQSLDLTHRAYEQISLGPRETVDGSFFLVANRFGRVEHAYDHLSPKIAPPTKIEWFKHEVKDQVERCVFGSGAKHFASDDSTNIADIAYELFANAEEWGSNDIDGSNIRPNIRGIILKVHGNPLQGFSQYDETPTTEYLDQWQAEQSVVPKLLEVSIFDAGVGLAQHALGKRVTETTSLTEEYEKVMQCLRKYSSASGRTYRGLGLHYVMSLLTQTKGFLRYRSGRLSLFRNFYKQPFMPDIGRDTLEPTRRTRLRAKNIYFFDWRSNSLDLVHAPPVDGALFTLLFPLGR
jgi:hypothetical protein